MNYKEARSISQTTETDEIKESKTRDSNIVLHPTFNQNSSVNEYIDELKIEINKLKKENSYLQSDEYLDTIFPTNYIQQLKDKIDLQEKEINLLKQKTKEILDTEIKSTYLGKTNSKLTSAGYTSSYVQGLQEELTKLTEENYYLKSQEYNDKISNHYVQKINSLKKKMENICQFVLKWSHNSLEREEVLMGLKQILEHGHE